MHGRREVVLVGLPIVVLQVVEPLREGVVVPGDLRHRLRFGGLPILVLVAVLQVSGDHRATARRNLGQDDLVSDAETCLGPPGLDLQPAEGNGPIGTEKAAARLPVEEQHRPLAEIAQLAGPRRVLADLHRHGLQRFLLGGGNQLAAAVSAPGLALLRQSLQVVVAHKRHCRSPSLLASLLLVRRRVFGIPRQRTVCTRSMGGQPMPPRRCADPRATCLPQPARTLHAFGGSEIGCRQAGTAATHRGIAVRARSSASGRWRRPACVRGTACRCVAADRPARPAGAECACRPCSAHGRTPSPAPRPRRPERLAKWPWHAR